METESNVVKPVSFCRVFEESRKATKSSALTAGKDRHQILMTASLIPIKAKLVLAGPCPAKKNLWKRGRAGRMFLDSTVKAQIDSLTIQARGQWRHGPVNHPRMRFTWYVAAARRDQDGMYTTVLDCLQEAGVLVNDNIAHNNGRKVLEECIFVPLNRERVEVEIEA
jgi:Holliday junction resolvase RusA-like endonuclease